MSEEVVNPIKGVKVTLINSAITKAFSEWTWIIEGAWLQEAISGTADNYFEAVEASQAAIFSSWSKAEVK